MAQETQGTPVQPRIPIDRERIAEFCRKWQIMEFARY
jgi:hypothetical protein